MALGFPFVLTERWERGFCSIITAAIPAFSLASGKILTLGSFNSWEKESRGAPDFQGKLQNAEGSDLGTKAGV